MPVKNRFTPAQIVELRTRRAAGESLKSLAEAFKTIPEYVSYIAMGKIHQAIGGPITKPMEVNAAERQIEFDGIKLSETKWAERVGLPALGAEDKTPSRMVYSGCPNHPASNSTI